MPGPGIILQGVGWPKDGKRYAISRAANGVFSISEITGGEGGGVPEAPSDGKPYARRSTAWAEATPALIGAAAASHHGAHEPGGGDAMAVDAVAATGSLRTLGTGAQQACAGDDSRLSDNRTDSNALHKATAGEIAAMTAKGSPGAADVLVIEDAADSNAKKKITIGSLPGGGLTHAQVQARVWLGGYL